jgi:hypothetical protein
MTLPFEHEHSFTKWRGEKIGWQCECGVVSPILPADDEEE